MWSFMHCRDIAPQDQNGLATATISAGAATSAAVPSANDLDMEDVQDQ